MNPFSFKSPSIDRLAGFDSADCTYGSEVVEIQGVVSSFQHFQPYSDEYEVYYCSFLAWRRIGQPLVHRKLTVLRPLQTDRSWRGIMRFPEHTVHQLQVLLSTDETRAIVADVLMMDDLRSEIAVDEEFLRVINDSQEPRVITTARFGDLLCHPMSDCFMGEVEWNGEMVELSLYFDDDQDLKPLLETAEQLWDEQSVWKQKIDAFAVEGLLSIKNDSWLDVDEQPLDAEQFKTRMKLQAIWVYSDGGFEFWHEDGDLFWGHSIQVAGSLTEGLTEVGIAG